MIKVRIYLNPEGRVFGIDAENHGDRIVCSAVSMLVINAANSIEVLTEDEFSLDYDENGGHFSLRMTGSFSRDAGLLLESLNIGLCSIAEEYPHDLSIEEITGQL